MFGRRAPSSRSHWVRSNFQKSLMIGYIDTSGIEVRELSCYAQMYTTASQLVKQSNVQKYMYLQHRSRGCAALPSLAPVRICNHGVLIQFSSSAPLLQHPRDQASTATVLLPSRMLNLDPISITVGWCVLITISTLSPGMTILSGFSDPLRP